MEAKLSPGSAAYEEGDAEFVYPPLQNLFCSICQELFKSPVILRECGHSFCEICIFQMLHSSANPTCPLCRAQIDVSGIHQNLVLDQLVKEQLVYCKYRKFGCTEHIPLMSKDIHQAHCTFRPSRCPHANRGCHFEGTTKFNADFRSCFDFGPKSHHKDLQQISISHYVDIFVQEFEKTLKSML